MLGPMGKEMVSRPSDTASSRFLLPVPLTSKLEEARGKHDEAIPMTPDYMT